MSYRNCYSRLVYLDPNSNAYDSLADLLLDGVSVKASIIDVHANVVMSQRFTNPSNSTVQGQYMFAILANSAVCGFEFVRGDGTVVKGHVMEKVEAKQVYDTAISQGKTASLGEEQTKDLFSITVGNILPLETVTINLTFLTPLTDDEKSDQVRFTFPREYATRYGTPPTAAVATASPMTGASQKLSIHVSVQQAGAIKSVSCPSSHPIELSLGRPDDADVDRSTPDSHFASVALVSPMPFLTQDFVLVITASGLDAPRCVVEKHETTTAVAVTFVPRFTLPDVTGGMDYIFLVDRSGSMDGSRMELVKEALIVLLRGLPTKGTRFNIVSFGSSHSMLWSSSKDYSQSTLDEATKHVDKFSADYGGTEIAGALEATFNSLPKERTRPVSVFLLTDGGAYDIATCVSTTQAALSSSGSFIRVFTVGIGSGVSTETCESIARAGEAIAVYVQEGEPVIGKCARLVRAARTPPVKDVTVLWPGTHAQRDEDDFEIVPSGASPAQGTTTLATTAPISLFGNDEPASDVGPPPKVKVDSITPANIQQAPLEFVGLFPGTRTQIYAVIANSSLPDKGFPSTIKVQGKVFGTNAPVELEFQVGTAMSQNLVHTLAARALINDREDGKKPPSVPGFSDAHLEADIVRLGVLYGLTSRYTSYVAVDEQSGSQPTVLQHLQEEKQSPSTLRRLFGSVGRGPATTTTSGYIAPSMRSAPQAFKLATNRTVSHSSGGAFNPSSMRYRGSPPSLAPPPPPGSAPAVMAMSLVSAPSYMHKRSNKPQWLQGEEDLLQEEEEQREPDPIPSAGGRLAYVARQQTFDGKFLLTDHLLAAINTVERDSAAFLALFSDDEVLSKDSALVATLLAIIWLDAQAADEGGEALKAKAEEWVGDYVATGSSLEQLKTKVQEAVKFV